MALDLQGYIIDDKGNRVGGRFDPVTSKPLELPSRDRFMSGESGDIEYKRMQQELEIQPITSASIQPTTPPNFTTPSSQLTPTTPNVEDYAPRPALPSTTYGDEITRMLKDIQGIDTSGQTAFRAGEEQRLGVEGLQKEEADLFLTLKQQQAEFTNTQNQGPLIEARIQEQFEGRGATRGGVAPIEAGELRKNALRASEIAARANTTAALLAGTQGKIMTANSLIERAVQQKYGASEEKRNALIENLKLALMNPALTREQEEQANAQLARQSKLKEADDKKKENSKTIMGWALAAKTNGATALQAQELMNIGLSANPDIVAAFNLYSPFSSKVEKLTGQSDFEQAFLRDKGRLPTVNELLDWKAKEAAAGRTPVSTQLTPDVVASRLNSVGLPPSVITTGNKLTKGNADKIAAQGVPPSVVELITQAILEGSTLEEVRQALSQGHGRETGFGYLDKYMSTLQGVKDEQTEITNPFK